MELTKNTRIKPKIAFVCVHNSCRSQIAEALGKHLASDIFESYSAGTDTKDRINPDAVRIMKQLYGIDMEETQYGTEAVHGSCGQLVPGDVVICISNSGETEEMRSTAMAIRNNGCKIIAVTGNPNSWLARFADMHLFAGVKNEGGPLNRAPRASILAEILILQSLSVILQEKRKLTPQEYVLRHPGGALGKLRDGEKQ